MPEAIVLRVAARYAREFSSPEALKEYLHEHPQADKSKHTVVKHDGDKDEGGGGHGEHDEHHEEKPKKSWKERLKGLSEAASKFVKDAPKAVHKFIEDEGFRRQTAMDAHKALVSAPEKFAKKALETVKHEVKEFKEAGQGIAALVKGQKMSPHQKKALKTVATHMAISVAAAALTASGPLAAAGAVGKGLAKHVAMKAVSNMLGHAHVLEELGHIGHGVKHLMEHLAAEKKVDPETVLMNLVAAAVAKELEGGLSDADLKEALEAASKEDEGQKKEAAWKVTAGPDELIPTLEAAEGIYMDLHKWVHGFPAVLRAAERDTDGLPDGWVWQDHFVRFFQAYDDLEARITNLDEGLQDIALEQPALSDIAKVARTATTEPPLKARVSYAIGDFQFFERAGRDAIAYETDILKEWALAFSHWVGSSLRVLKAEIREGTRRIQNETP